MKRFKKDQIVIATTDVKHLVSNKNMPKGSFARVILPKPDRENMILVFKIPQEEVYSYWPTVDQIRALTSKERYHFKKQYPNYVK